MNKKVITEKLLQSIWCCENALTLRDNQYLSENETRLRDNLAQVTRAFSGSWIGYHACVYYHDFRTPPPGDHFSSEWGLMRAMSYSTSGNWAEYSRDAIHSAIMTGVDKQYESRYEKASEQAKRVLSENYETVQTILDALLVASATQTLQRIHDDIAKIDLNITTTSVLNALRPHGSFMTRDSTAMSQGIISPVHAVVQAEQIALLHPFNAIESLVSFARRILNYMDINDLIERKSMPKGKKVFVGHGRSPLWRELKDFIKDRLHLEWEEFNREPAAGLATSERLQEMLDASCFAFLVMTAEDQHADSTLHARENVVHEVGLFQGHLGFRKAIVVLEEGCSEFSNITGLTQIRFAKGNISACYEDIRRVLEREGIIEKSA